MDMEKLVERLQTDGYTKQEIDKIMQGLEDEKNGLVYSAEDVYKSLFARKPQYV